MVAIIILVVSSITFCFFVIFFVNISISPKPIIGKYTYFEIASKMLKMKNVICSFLFISFSLNIKYIVNAIKNITIALIIQSADVDVA